MMPCHGLSASDPLMWMLLSSPSASNLPERQKENDEISAARTAATATATAMQLSQQKHKNSTAIGVAPGALLRLRTAGGPTMSNQANVTLAVYASVRSEGQS